MDKKRINPVRFPRYIDTDYIDQIIDWLEYLLEKAEGQFKGLDGELLCRMSKSGLIYSRRIYERVNGVRSSKTVTIGDSSSETVSALQKDRRCRAQICALKTDICELKRFRQNFMPYDPLTIEAGLPSAYRSIWNGVVGSEHSDGKMAKWMAKWAEADYDREPMDPNVSPYVTVDGNRVRSMAEIIIYNTLRYHGINFRYESKLELNGLAGGRVARYPDFTVMCCDGSMIYWEHAGMMGKESYRNSFYERLEVYRRNGIRLGDNLIVTTSRDNWSVDSFNIDLIATGFVLPRAFGNRA